MIENLMHPDHLCKKLTQKPNCPSEIKLQTEPEMAVDSVTVSVVIEVTLPDEPEETDAPDPPPTDKATRVAGAIVSGAVHVVTGVLGEIIDILKPAEYPPASSDSDLP